MVNRNIADIIRQVSIVPSNSAIPYAAGLAKEISRKKGVIGVSTPKSELLKDGKKRVSFDVRFNSKIVGVVRLLAYRVMGMPRIAELIYVGTVPGYQETRPAGQKVWLEAREFSEKNPAFIDRDSLFMPNDTKQSPLYRFDTYPLVFADHEENSLNRKLIY